MIPKHEVAECVICGKEYMRGIKGGSRNESKMLRGCNTITCSRRCAKEYRNTARINDKTQFKGDLQ